MDKQRWAKLEEYMLLRMQDSAHDRQHVYRVLNNAIEIAKGEDHVNMEVLMVAALLHDIGRADEKADPKADHAVTGGDRAYQVLIDAGYDHAFAEHVRQCIRTHRFRRNDPPATIEAKILFDADKLDVCGAIGIARTLMYSGAHDRPIYTTDPDGSISDGKGDTEDSFFREYRFKLEGMYDRFLTRRGAELAKERQKAAVDFYDALLAEVRTGKGKQAVENLLDA
ncbi:MAG: HD domain-containing protein [Clostridia bacterium]|nr:HD domain-containing protein [Clostridia bacterium]